MPAAVVAPTVAAARRSRRRPRPEAIPTSWLAWSTSRQGSLAEPWRDRGSIAAWRKPDLFGPRRLCPGVTGPPFTVAPSGTAPLRFLRRSRPGKGASRQSAARDSVFASGILAATAASLARTPSASPGDQLTAPLATAFSSSLTRKRMFASGARISKSWAGSLGGGGNVAVLRRLGPAPSRICDMMSRNLCQFQSPQPSRPATGRGRLHEIGPPRCGCHLPAAVR